MGSRCAQLLFAALVACLLLSSGVVQALAIRKLVSRERCPCDEIYVVQEGETLQTISDKCHAPLILADNPQIQDTDDLFPGVVLMMQCADDDVGAVF